MILFFCFILVQGLVVPISSWHLLALYSSLYEEGAKETLIPLHRKKLIHDLFRYAVLHGGVLLLFVVYLHKTDMPIFDTPILLAHLVLLFLFYQLIAVAILTLIKNLELTVAIIATYTFTEVVTQGTFMPWPHLFVFQEPYYGLEFNLKFIFLAAGILLSIVQLWRTFR